MVRSPAAADPSLAEQEALASMRSLRMLLALCVLTPVLLFGLFAVHRYHQLHQEAEVRVDRALRVAREHALKVLETNETMLRHIVDIAGEGADPDKLHVQLQALSKDKPQIQSLWVIDATGAPRASDRFAPMPAGVNFADRDFFRWHSEHREAGRLYFSDLLVGKATKTPFFDVSRVILDAQGGFAGIASTSLTPDYFLKFHQALAADEPGLSIAMFREDGALYARWPRLPDTTRRIKPDSPVLARLGKGETEGAIHAVSSLDGQERLLLFTRLGEYPVYVGTGLELAAIRSAWAREMMLVAAFALVPVLGLLVAGVMAIKRARLSLEAAQRLREESEARRQVEEALRQSQKMEAMGRLTGGVAHDFNNALMVISANLQILQMKQPQVTGPQTEGIARAVGTAANLTRQLLAFSRRQALTPQVVSLQDKLPALTGLLSPVLGSQVPLSIEVEAGTSPIEVDVAELELALINLAVNAKDAMASGGRFSIRARNVPAPMPMQGDAVLIEASDNGTGIPADVLARVFEPFFTTKPVGQGTGLGLSQVYGLCQRSGGTARVRSTEGLGTSVDMYFPASRSAAAEDTDTDDFAGSTLNLRVLLVEDNREVAAAIRPVLQEMGCDVTHFTTAAQAVEWIGAQANDVDVLLTDVVMPGDMDGLALAQHVRRGHPGVGIVVMTGYAQHLEEIDRQGFTVLAKPWTAANLARALRTVQGRDARRDAAWA